MKKLLPVTEISSGELVSYYVSNSDNNEYSPRINYSKLADDKSPGIYLLNDGITLVLFLVYSDGTSSSFNILPLPSQLSQYIQLQEYKDEYKESIEEVIESNLLNIQKSLSRIEAQLQSELKSSLDGNTLIKTIAVSQNPELAKELIQKGE